MVRYGLGVIASAIVTVVLFYIMQMLIANDDNILEEGSKIRITDFVRLEQDQEVETKVRKPKPPPPPDQPPPDAPKPTFDANAASTGVDVSAVNVNVDLNIGGTGGFSSDGEYLPIVKVAPQYPRRAQTRGIEGYVILEFVVTKTGAVKDPVVVEAQPQGIFDNAAIQAALKFKYKPKVVDGEPIDVAGVRNKITFELED
ncbi:MAG: energy transducer TonB [Pseudomonadales bacterium]|nr:energy transducer TonB [Pseudomonadales bacterium]MCP5184904.1 energy transducer TonB [Pseudomonadales bacterium]